MVLFLALLISSTMTWAADPDCQSPGRLARLVQSLRLRVPPAKPRFIIAGQTIRLPDLAMGDRVRYSVGDATYDDWEVTGLSVDQHPRSGEVSHTAIPITRTTTIFTEAVRRAVEWIESFEAGTALTVLDRGTTHRIYKFIVEKRIKNSTLLRNAETGAVVSPGDLPWDTIEAATQGDHLSQMLGHHRDLKNNFRLTIETDPSLASTSGLRAYQIPSYRDFFARYGSQTTFHSRGSGVSDAVIEDAVIEDYDAMLGRVTLRVDTRIELSKDILSSGSEPSLGEFVSSQKIHVYKEGFTLSTLPSDDPHYPVSLHGTRTLYLYMPVRVFENSFEPVPHQGDRSMPGLVSSESQRRASRVDELGLIGVRHVNTEIGTYNFKNQKGSTGEELGVQDAEIRTYELGQGAESRFPVRVIMLHDNAPPGLRVGWGEVEPLLARTPALYRSTVQDLVIFGGTSTTPEAAGLASTGSGPRTVSLFWNRRNSSDNVKTYLHELGHLIANQLWGSVVPPAAWVKAMTEDLRHSGEGHITRYAGRNLQEDFAETVEDYLLSNAGGTNPDLRRRFSRRFEFLDELFQIDSHRLMFEVTRRRVFQKVKKIAGPLALVALASTYFAVRVPQIISEQRMRSEARDEKDELASIEPEDLPGFLDLWKGPDGRVLTLRRSLTGGVGGEAFYQVVEVTPEGQQRGTGFFSGADAHDFFYARMEEASRQAPTPRSPSR